MIVPSHLIIVINSAHVFIIPYHRLGCIHCYSCPVFLFPLHIFSDCWVSVCCGKSHRLAVLPYTNTEVFVLYSFTWSSPIQALFWCLLQAFRKAFSVSPQSPTTIETHLVKIHQEVGTCKVVVEVDMSKWLLVWCTQCLHHVCVCVHTTHIHVAKWFDMMYFVFAHRIALSSPKPQSNNIFAFENPTVKYRTREQHAIMRENQVVPPRCGNGLSSFRARRHCNAPRKLPPLACRPVNTSMHHRAGRIIGKKQSPSEVYASNVQQLKLNFLSQTKPTLEMVLVTYQCNENKQAPDTESYYWDRLVPVKNTV